MIRLEIYTQDYNKVTTTVEHYNAEEINSKINERQTQTIVIGDVIIDPRNILKVVPVRSEENG
ncbi:hypothetical protein ACX12E_18945 [Paenibacillus vandeheii]|uniref:hypothetical protein n=1 Tax=Paenibacillus sp. PCH8 TaxID=2066524 RepID=UPI000CF88907|nr:hypothetical protein [Paenibacillus sp. PCH8]PQP81656.1 hypothetical protein C0Q44_18315 [Paenibacillus sp. PCH8]